MSEVEKVKSKVQRLAAIPVYKRIEEDMRHKVQTGIWPANTVLPSRAKLATEYGVGLPTLERAIELLITDGTLLAKHGSGTFVPPATQSDSTRAKDIDVPYSTSPIEANTVLAENLHQSVSQKKSKQALGIIGELPILSDVNGQLRVGESRQDWTVRIASSLEKAFSFAGGITYQVNRFQYSNSILSTSEMINILLDRGANALAIANVHNSRQVTQEVLAVLDPARVPIVLLPWDAGDGPLASVTYDQVYSGYRAAQHLLQEGYSPLVFLDVWDLWWAKERLRGALAAVRDAHFPEEILHTYSSKKLDTIVMSQIDLLHQPTYLIGYEAGKEIFQENLFADATHASQEYPIGIIAPSDATASGILQAAKELGKLPGRDFGLVGFDDDPLSSAKELTTMAPPLEEIGQAAAHLLFDMLHGHYTTQHIAIRSHLIIRASTYR